MATASTVNPSWVNALSRDLAMLRSSSTSRTRIDQLSISISMSRVSASNPWVAD